MTRTADSKLRGLALFSGCSPDELDRVGRLLVEERVDAGDVLVAEGTAGDELLVVAEGLARVTKGVREVAYIGPGSFVGEGALLHDAPRGATVEAVTPMRVLVVDRRGFDTLLDEVPSVGAAVRATSAARTEQLRLVERCGSGGAVTNTPRRRRRVFIPVAVIVALCIAGGLAYVTTQRNVATRVSLASSLRDLHRAPVATGPSATADAPDVAGQASVVPTASSPAPASQKGTVLARRSTTPQGAAGAASTAASASAPFVVPATGIYTYGTTGSESISMFGAHHDYPPETYATVRPSGGACGWQVDWPVLAEHVDHHARCSTAGQLLVVSDGREVEFFHQRDGETFICTPPAPLGALADAVGAAHQATCRASSGDGSVTQRATYLGRADVTVGTTVVHALHVVVDSTMAGRATGTARTEYWLHPDTGLTLREVRSVDSDAQAVFGHVHYVEHASFTLTSLTPRT